MRNIYFAVFAILCLGLTAFADVRIKQRTGSELIVSVSNPTRFDCELRVFSEASAASRRPLEPFALWDARTLSLSAGAEEALTFPVAKAG